MNILKYLLIKFVNYIASKSIYLDFLISKIRKKIKKSKQQTSQGENAYRFYHFEQLNRNLNLLSGFIDLDKISEYDVAEIGPGDNLSIGILMISIGFKSWKGFDSYPYASIEKSFRNTKKIANDFIKEYRNKKVLNYKTLAFKSSDPFINNHMKKIKIEEDIKNKIIYNSPYSLDDLGENAFDIIYSQACFEHLKDIEKFYYSIYNSLKPNGILLCQIDFGSHGTSMLFNGHYRYNEKQQSYFNNRYDYEWINGIKPSIHLDIIEKLGLKKLYISRTELKSTFSNNLNKNFKPKEKNINSFDISTRDMLILYQK